MRQESFPVSPELRAQVAQLLGREPCGLRAVPVTRADGGPVVIRVATLVDERPFPTLYWLVDRELNYRIDREEAVGLIRRLQQRIDREPYLQEALREDHRRYIADRNRLMSAADRRGLQERGYYPGLQCRGIGGIGNFRYIRCLHTWYAAHLVRPNTIGHLLDAHWADQGTV